MKKKLNEKPGWIKIHRKMLDWEWYDDLNVWRVFIHCLLMANFKDKKWHGRIIKRGSFITSRQKLSLGTKLSPMQIRSAITKLQSTNEITSKSTNKYTVISVINYDKYQSNNQQITSKQPAKVEAKIKLGTKKQPTNQPAKVRHNLGTSKNTKQPTNQPASNQQVTTTKEGKEGKNDNNKSKSRGKRASQSEVKRIYSSYKSLINSNSRLTPAGREKIRVRLKTYSVAELVKAMTNFSQDSWWMEHNASRGVAWFFANDERIDALINLQPRKREKSIFEKMGVKPPRL